MIDSLNFSFICNSFNCFVAFLVIDDLGCF